jgi:hypothetical protein
VPRNDEIAPIPAVEPPQPGIDHGLPDAVGEALKMISGWM